MGCLSCGQMLFLWQQILPAIGRTVQNKSNIYMQVGSTVRRPAACVSLVGWSLSHEYQQDMLTLHDWDAVLNQSWGFRHGNRRSGRIPEGTGCSLFWAFLFNLITVSVCANWTNNSQVVLRLWKVGHEWYRHGNAKQPKPCRADLYIETRRKWVAQREGAPRGQRLVEVNMQ